MKKNLFQPTPPWAGNYKLSSFGGEYPPPVLWTYSPQGGEFLLYPDTINSAPMGKWTDLRQQLRTKGVSRKYIMCQTFS